MTDKCSGRRERLLIPGADMVEGTQLPVKAVFRTWEMENYGRYIYLCHHRSFLASLYYFANLH